MWPLPAHAAALSLWPLDFSAQLGHLELVGRALADHARLTENFPHDAHAPLGATQRGEILFRTGAFEAAGQAFEAALLVARQAGRDSLARRAEAAIPVCYYRQAEGAVAADSTRFASHAELFQKVATGWPTYEHADLAQYRAGLAWAGAGRTRDAVFAMHSVILHFPRSDLVRDAHVQVAKLWENSGERDSAAAAYARFARRYPADESSPGAWLKAADLLAAAGHEPAADELRLDYLRRYPNDAETAMEILETLARRELAGVDAQHPISKLIGPGPRKGQAPKPPISHLADYLRHASAHPKLSSLPLLAQIRFLQGEEAFAGLDVRRGEAGPVLSASHAYLECRVAAAHDGGDHVLVVGRVVGGAVQTDGKPATHVRKTGKHY